MRRVSFPRLTVRRFLLGSALLVIAGLFYFVVLSDWPRGWYRFGSRAARVDPHALPKEVDASKLTGTTILPHLEGPITAGRNYVYCASFQLAWDELRKKAGPEGIQVQDIPPLAAALNRSTLP